MAGRELEVVLAAVALIGAGGIVGLALARWPRLATAIAVVAAVAGGALGLVAAAWALGTGATAELSAAWSLPGARLVVGIDPLSAFFLVPLFALGAVAAVYGRGYLGARVLAAVELDLLIVAMALVLVARHAILFLIAWEAMSLLAFLLIATEHQRPEVRRAGWAYLVGAHLTAAALVALFLGLGASAGGLDFDSLASAGGGPGLFALALLGFGIKAGVVGLHVWLPEAHAAAPSHVSALMSGVLIKLGVYGIVRVALILGPASGAWIGVVLMIAGVAGAVLGIALALYQRDLKRILAYSSVENVGVILLALGLGLWARARGDGPLAALALGGGLLHVWNHAAMKNLLFLGAGSVIHGAGGQDIEKLGGLLRRMPRTGAAMLVGATAIAALPPLNGFVGEWLIYRGLTRVGVQGAAASGLAAIGGAAALALASGLAALCFVRLIGIVLLGSPRSDAAAAAHESPAALTWPPMLLAAACVVGAIAGPAILDLDAPLIAQLGGASAEAVAAARGQLLPVILVNAGLLVALGAGITIAVRRGRRAAVADTWGCGYARPTARMQYTGRGFAELLVARVLPRWARPLERLRPPEGFFPEGASLATDDRDPLTRSVYEPFFAAVANRFVRLRFLQHGTVHVYVLYVALAAIAALAWVAVRGWWQP